MSTCTEDEWTCIKSATQCQINMESTACEVPTQADASVKDSTMDNIFDENKDKNSNDCTCDAESAEDPADEEYCRPRRAGRRSLTPTNYYPSPVPLPIHVAPPPPPPPPPPIPQMISSSTQLLDQVGREDKIVGLPHPAPKREAYLATYPFGARDVKKWSWLFAAGIEDEFITSNTRDSEKNFPHNRSARYVHTLGDGDVPAVYLSRALDEGVVPDDTKHNVRYFIITRNSFRSSGYKLIVAESRKAAGAMVHECQTDPPKRFKKANNVEEAVAFYKKGFIGVIC